MVEMAAAMSIGERYTPKTRDIKDCPDSFTQWVKDNADKIKAARERGTEPYFIRNNAAVIDDILNPGTLAASLPKIEDGIVSVRNSMPIRTPQQIANVREIESALNIECGEPMSFDEANEMRANPNYKKGVKYRQNCQSSVVANEMRRMGFDVEAYGNDKKEWYMPTLLAKRPEIAFMDVSGNPPTPIRVNYNGDLIASLNNQMTDTGRYHLRF